jgi:cell wall-associated NlpC family hydrolase
MKKILATSVLALGLSLGFASIGHAQHIVVSGDSMSKIAKDHHMSLKDLISLNPHIKDPNKIQPSDYIIIRSAADKKKDMTDYARSLQDITAYKFGGNNFPYEVDCSAWAKGVYQKFGITLPRVSRDQARTGEPVAFTELQLGDLMFFSTRADKVITHTGIYLGDNFWISNLNEKEDVKVLSTFGRWTQDYFLWGSRHKM